MSDDDARELTEREVTDWLGRSLFTAAAIRVASDPSVTIDILATSLVLELLAREPRFLTESEAFERTLRRILTSWWPELQRQAAAIRARSNEEETP